MTAVGGALKTYASLFCSILKVRERECELQHFEHRSKHLQVGEVRGRPYDRFFSRGSVN